jgi:hypothetical protein
MINSIYFVILWNGIDSNLGTEFGKEPRRSRTSVSIRLVYSWCCTHYHMCVIYLFFYFELCLYYFIYIFTYIHALLFFLSTSLPGSYIVHTLRILHTTRDRPTSPHASPLEFNSESLTDPLHRTPRPLTLTRASTLIRELHVQSATEFQPEFRIQT